MDRHLTYPLLLRFSLLLFTSIPPHPSQMRHLPLNGKARIWIELEKNEERISKKYKKRDSGLLSLFNCNRRRPTLPGRVQPSTISAEGLNFCVRNENRWIPFAIVTGMVECLLAHSQLHSKVFPSIIQSSFLMTCI